MQYALDLDGVGLRLHKAHPVIADPQPKFVSPFEFGYVALAGLRKTL